MRFLPDMGDTFTRFHEPENQRRVADRYWALMGSIGVLAMLTSIAYGVWQFIAEPIAIDTVVTTKTSAGFELQEVTDLVKKLEARQGAFEELLK